MSNKALSNTARKYILITSIVFVCFGVIGLLIYVVHTRSTNVTADKPAKSKGIDYSPAKPSDNAANEARKSNPKDTGSQTLNSQSAPVPFSVTISRATVDSNSRSVTVAANVNGTTTGSCIFKYSRSSGGQVEINSSAVTVQPTNQSAMCAPTTTILPYSGRWYVSVTLTDNGKIAENAWPQALSL